MAPDLHITHAVEPRQRQHRLIADVQEDHGFIVAGPPKLVVQQTLVENADVLGRELGEVNRGSDATPGLPPRTGTTRPDRRLRGYQPLCRGCLRPRARTLDLPVVGISAPRRPSVSSSRGDCERFSGGYPDRPGRGLTLELSIERLRLLIRQPASPTNDARPRFRRQHSFLAAAARGPRQRLGGEPGRALRRLIDIGRASESQCPASTELV